MSTLYLLLSLLLIYALVALIMARAKRISFDEACVQIFNIIIDKKPYRVCEDPALCDELLKTLKITIGQERYRVLCDIAETYQLVRVGLYDSLPTFSICVDLRDENEQILIEKRLENALKRVLRRHDLDPTVYSEWTEDEEILLPRLILQCAENSEQSDYINKKKTIDADTVVESKHDLEDE